MDNSKYKTKITIIIITVVLLLSLVSFGYFYISSSQSDKNRLAGGCFNTSFSDGESINLTNAFPESFDEAKENTPYEFTITNTCNLPSKYYIILNVKEGSFNSDFIDYTLNNSNFEKLSNTLENTKYSMDDGYNKSFIIGSGLLNQNESITHNLRIWIDENVSQNDLATNSKFTAQIKVVNEVASMLGTDKIKNLVAGENSSSTDVITKDSPAGSTCTNTLAYDGTVDNNLRYVGANPCNYVSFNNELWQIIGVMNNVDDGTGKKEVRLKLVRNEPLGGYAWDSSDSSVNGGNGEANWAQSDLMQELNGDYLNSNLNANTMWYNGSNNQKTGEFDYKKVLNKNSKHLIKNAKWYLGLISNYNGQNAKAEEFYNLERTKDNPFNTFDWTGMIGLIYLSDYAYSAGGSNRSACLTNKTYDYKDGCKNYTWLFDSTKTFWTISPGAHYSSIACYYSSGSTDTSIYAHYPHYYVKPALYLASNTSIVSGNGSEENPYILS